MTLFNSFFDFLKTLLDWLFSDVSHSISFSALFVSIVSLIVYIEQSHSNNRHKRLSVKPLLFIECKKIPPKYFGFVIENKGLGPALIKNLFISHKGLKYDCFDPLNLEIFQRLIGFPVRPHYFTLSNLSVIYPGESKPIFWFDDKRYCLAIGREIVFALRQFTFHCVYKSMYKRSFKGSFHFPTIGYRDYANR